MADGSKIKVITQELKNRCRKQSNEFIREATDILSNNSWIILKRTKEDHRYAQGYLQAIDDVRDLLNNP